MGAFLFEGIGVLLFKLNLWEMSWEILAQTNLLHRMWIIPWSGAVLSLLIAGWTVGGAIRHLLALLRGWATLPRAGGM